MALVSKNIPNLINGVSQQPAALRLESQGEVQENGFSDVVDGLKKRPPTKFLKKLVRVDPYHASYNDDGYDAPFDIATAGHTSDMPSGYLDNGFFHTYKRSSEEQYQVFIASNKVVYVYDMEGRLRYESGKGSWDASGNLIVANTDDTSYLPSNPQDITATSVADATFIVNRNKTVAMSSLIKPSNDLNQALVYLKSVNYGRTYTVDIDSKSGSGSADATHTTDKQTTITSNNNDIINSDGLKVSSVMSNGSTCLRDQIASDLGSSVTHNFSALTASFNGSPSIITVLNVTVSGITVSTANIAAGNIVVQVDGQTIPYDATGANGWMRVSDTTIKLPSSVLNILTRPAGSVTYLNTSSTNGYLTPTVGGREPYFIVNTLDAGAIGDFDIVVTDDDGGVNLKAFKGNAKSFTDLPNQCSNGFRLGVVGDNQKKEDDFHVVFVGEAGSGYWKETVGYNLQNYFDLATMPHTLKQNADLSFTFGQGEWDERKAGDDDTNPAPSFVGNKISDIFFHRNRLGVLSGENVLFSEASGYYNFWRTTVRTLLDSDPIDVAVSQNEVSELKAAVPIQDNLLLFSSLNQFTLSATQLLTPAEVTVDQSTKYECDLTASPVGAGNSVFFATKSGDFAGVREFFTRDDTEIKDAVDITSHVPEYLAGNIREFAASANEDMLVALTSSNKKECYVYKWYNSSTERLQSSWSKWVFDKDIASVFFNNAELYFTFTDGSYEVMSLTGTSSTEADVLLDHRQYITGAHSVSQLTALGLTTATRFVGYKGIVVAQGNTTAELQKVSAYLNGTHTNAANQTVNNYVYLGEPYTFKFQLSEQVFKPAQGDSTKLARLQLRKTSFNFNDTGYFEVDVTSTGRSTKKTTFTGRTLGQLDSLLGYAAIVKDGTQEVGVQSQASETEIIITNDTHLPCVFQSAEWEGFVTLRNQRL